METALKRLYEGLFLVDSAIAASDWEGTVSEIERVLQRSEAEVVTLTKWDERRLAYEAKCKSRGTYILTYFNCDPSKITAVERDVQLSEQILRVMILKTEGMSREDIEKETPLAKAERRQAETVENAETEAAERDEILEDVPAEEVTVQTTEEKAE